MNTSHPVTCGAHLIGSIPLADAETVFRTVATTISPYVRRIPDGETGERTRWIYFQRQMLSNHPAMEIDPTVPPFALYQWDGTLMREAPWLRFRADRLSIQWDVCQEVLIFEDDFPDRPADYRSQISTELARLGNAVPETVEMGYHLCYGSPADEHLVMPKDMAVMVEIVNGFREALSRRIDFLHLPVPKDRTDVAYFQPLAHLRRDPDTALYLGLIHHADASGDRARIQAAQAVVRDFGVASECGWGRTDPQRVPGLLASHRAAVEFIQQGAWAPVASARRQALQGLKRCEVQRGARVVGFRRHALRNEDVSQKYRRCRWRQRIDILIWNPVRRS